MAPPVLRFAPSPNGRLHLGHAYSALLNEDFTRRLGGRLLLRIEDIDPGRSRRDFADAIRDDLAWLGLRFEPEIRRQSERLAVYRTALEGLARARLAYPCFCSRGAIAERIRAEEVAGNPVGRDPDGAPLYPGTCRALPEAEAMRRIAAGAPHGWRLDMARALAAAPGPHAFDAFDEDGSRKRCDAGPARWGDALIGRRDVPTSYHLSVVLDDADQGVTHVVRGADLHAATDLHVLLQALLRLPSPAYHHHRLILGADGRKLAKSKGSKSLADLRAHGETPATIRARLGFA